MGKRVLTPEFIAFMSVLYLFQSPGGLADISNGFWWFIIPALSAQFISTAVNIVEMSVGPTTWKKVEGHANKATSVANFFELIAVFEMSMMATSDSFWGRLFINCVWIGMIGLILVDRVVCMAKGGSTYQVEKNGLSVQ